MTHGPMGTFYIVTLYLQEVREFSPLITGLSWLPFAISWTVTALRCSSARASSSPRLLWRR